MSQDTDQATGHEQYGDLIAGQGATADCGCGWPITDYDGEWLHVFNPELTGSDDHDARPDHD